MNKKERHVSKEDAWTIWTVVPVFDIVFWQYMALLFECVGGLSLVSCENSKSSILPNLLTIHFSSLLFARQSPFPFSLHILPQKREDTIPIGGSTTSSEESTKEKDEEYNDSEDENEGEGSTLHSTNY